MIDFSRITTSDNKYVDGQLDDGRLVEIKATIPRNLNIIVKQAVAMANLNGGIILFGIKSRESFAIVGISGDIKQSIKDINRAINEMSIGIDYSLTEEIVNNKEILILQIKASLSTAYFSRTKTSPARQIAYRYDSDNEAMNYTKVYKYMTLESFTMSLCNKTLRFVEPSGWNDKFEQRFYCANYKFPKATGNTPQVFATCATRAENSEAAWKVYSHGKGLSHLCLQLELDMVSLRKQLRASGFRFEEKVINYKPEHQILSLHKKKGLDCQKYFKSFTVNSFLNLLSLKREAYAYEQEVRLFIIPDLSNECRNTCKKAKFIDLPFDWRLAIKKVRFDSNFSDAELLLIQSSCFFVNINPIIFNYKFVGNRKPPKGSLDVVFERFDINDMPGTRRITIS